MFHETDLINIQKKTNSVVGYDIFVENSNITIYFLFLFTLISILNKYSLEHKFLGWGLQGKWHIFYNSIFYDN